MSEGTVTTGDSLLRLDVREALAFFDDPPPSAIGHATAVVGVLGRIASTKPLPNASGCLK